MLLFNLCRLDSKEEVDEFQNISCYCLTNLKLINYCFYCISKHLMLLFNYSVHIYIHNMELFQNISCYCLTFRRCHRSSGKRKFQNISCYCLTIQCHLLNASKWISKHLMLLFNFHQSFVPVVPLHISKHLMLLFNN